MNNNQNLINKINLLEQFAVQYKIEQDGLNELPAKGTKIQTVTQNLSRTNVPKYRDTGAVNDRVQFIEEEKKNLMDKVKSNYNKNTDKLSNIFDNSDSIDTIINIQEKNIGKNNKKINKIENDVMTLRQQIELSKNEYKKRSLLIFLLKYIFILLLIGLLFSVLIKNNTLPPKLGGLLFGIIFIIVLGIILYNIYINKDRDSAMFRKVKFYDKLKSSS